MIKDASLLQVYAAKGDQAAFAEFVRRHLNLVYSVAVRRTNGDAQLAEEVAQTVFTSVARKAAALAKHDSITAWLFTSARYAAGAAMRGKQRRQQREHEAYVMDQLHRKATDTEWENLRPLLDDFIDTLNEREREAVLLRFYHDRSFVEMGETLRISADAARMRVDRALERLGTKLQRRGIPSTAAALALALGQQAIAAPAGLAANVSGTAMISVAAGITPGAALLQFMGTAKVTAGLTVVVVAATATLATREARAFFGVQKTLEASTQDLAVVENELQQTQTNAQRADDRVAAALKATEAARDESTSSGSAAVTATLSNRNGVDPRALGKQFLERHPEVKDALAARTRAHIATRFASHYPEWGLTPEKIQQFEALMAETESMSVAGENDAVMYLSLGAGLSSEELDRRVHALLGEDAYWKYRSAKDLAPVQQTVMDLAGALYYTDTPLSSEQIAKLNAIIDETHRSRMPSAVKWELAAVKAKQFLLPPQSAAADDILAKRSFDQALSAALKRASVPTRDTSRPTP